MFTGNNTALPGEEASLQADVLLKVWTFLPPFIIAMGTVGNLLTLVAVGGRHCKKNSFSVYLASLALVDTVTLYVNVLNSWLIFAFDVDIQRTSVSCKVLGFSIFVFEQMSGWLVAALAIERLICVYFPDKVKHICTPKTGFIIVISLLSLLSACNSHELYGFQLNDIHNDTFCGFVNDSYGTFFYNYFMLINTLIQFFVPMTLIVGANTALVVRIKVINNRATQSPATKEIKRKRTQYMTVFTLLISFVFIVMTGPVALYVVLRPYLFEDSEIFYTTNDTEYLLSTVTYHLLFLNHAVNFSLYVLSGRKFRNDLILSFCEGQRFINAKSNDSEKEKASSANISTHWEK